MANSLSSTITSPPTYVFFCAYLARDREDEAARVNRAILDNFLNALSQTGHLKSIKRIIFTCGLKQYGVHLGRPKNPMEESDARLLPGDENNWPPNFYYDQEDVLAEHASLQISPGQ